MIQQRKKDYLQRLIEEFFAKFHKLMNEGQPGNSDEKREVLNAALDFFSENLDTKQIDDAKTLIEKIGDIDLLEQYAKLLLLKYESVDIKEIEQLHTALDIVRYLEAADKTFSWDRTALREDLLRLLDESN